MGIEATGTPGDTPSGKTPSGLFPTGPPRPAYREPHPVRAGAVLAGVAGAGAWLALFALLGHDLASRVWWTVGAGAVAWLGALALAYRGERGAGVGVAVAVAVAWVVDSTLVALYWAVTADWPLW